MLLELSFDGDKPSRLLLFLTHELAERVLLLLGILWCFRREVLGNAFAEREIAVAVVLIPPFVVFFAFFEFQLVYVLLDALPYWLLYFSAQSFDLFTFALHLTFESTVLCF